MRLLVFHPTVAARSCEECKRWWWDDALKGERFVFSEKRVGENTKRGVPIERPPHVPTPCHHCPKGSPENAEKIELSAKNWQTVKFYELTQACHGGNLTDEMRADEALMKNLAVVGGIFKQYERKAAADSLAGVVAAVLGAVK